MQLSAKGHDPVLLAEVLSLSGPQNGQIFVDCTLGRAGHAKAIAERLGTGGLLIGLDADLRNLQFAAAELKSAPCPTRLFHANFAELPQVLRQAGRATVDGILADLGVSTNQLFDAQYGLSFDRPGPLDMRLDNRLERTAADLVNHLPEAEIADLLHHLAQERYCRAIARKIGQARRISPILTTERLAEIVRGAIPRRFNEPIDPATKTFMALRMAVNEEVKSLSGLLQHGPAALSRGGRMAVIAFQSTEDRAVKQAFAQLRQVGAVELLTPKAVMPGEAEIAANPRSRSARLRAIRKL